MAEALAGRRGARASFRVNVELDRGEKPFFASGVMDRKPMYVVSSCATTLITEVAKRKTRTESGATEEIEVPFPEMNALYRRYFNAVDLFNRSCFGPQSMQGAIKTKSWYRRLFLAMVGMCETNAMHAYAYSVGPVERYEWLAKLSDALLNNPWAADTEAGVVVEGDEDEHSNLYYLNHAVKCTDCGRLTHWRCGCGDALCAPGRSDKLHRGPCYYSHIRDVILEEVGVPNTQQTQ